MEKSTEEKNVAEARNKQSEVSPAVIKRLPRYFRYLRELIRNGKMRISSADLSEMMHVTASQIRQDLNCFGGFGQQGYGYNVNYLYAKICEILGVGVGYTAVVIGAGNLGRALARSPMYEKRGVDIIALFDVDPALIGTEVGGAPVYHIDELPAFCETHRVDIAVLTLTKEYTLAAAEQLYALKIPGIWNLTGRDLESPNAETVVENVHIGDSLMTLTYELSHREEGWEKNEVEI